MTWTEIRRTRKVVYCLGCTRICFPTPVCSSGVGESENVVTAPSFRSSSVVGQMTWLSEPLYFRCRAGLHTVNRQVAVQVVCAHG